MNIVLVGKTGSGKTEISRLLTEYFRYEKIKTCTTRKRRDGESDEAYTFLTDEEFDHADMVLKTTYCGNRYGTLKGSLNNCDNTVLIVDPSGLRELEKIEGFTFVSFFISCATFKRYERCLNRGNHEEVVLGRIMKEPYIFDSLKTDFVISNEGDVWSSVTKILDCVKDVVGCSHQDCIGSGSFQQV